MKILRKPLKTTWGNIEYSWKRRSWVMKALEWTIIGPAILGNILWPIFRYGSPLPAPLQYTAGVLVLLYVGLIFVQHFQPYKRWRGSNSWTGKIVRKIDAWCEHVRLVRKTQQPYAPYGAPIFNIGLAWIWWPDTNKATLLVSQDTLHCIAWSLVGLLRVPDELSLEEQMTRFSRIMHVPEESRMVAARKGLEAVIVDTTPNPLTGHRGPNHFPSHVVQYDFTGARLPAPIPSVLFEAEVVLQVEYYILKGRRQSGVRLVGYRPRTPLPVQPLSRARVQTMVAAKELTDVIEGPVDVDSELSCPGYSLHQQPRGLMLAIDELAA